VKFLKQLYLLICSSSKGNQFCIRFLLRKRLLLKEALVLDQVPSVLLLFFLPQKTKSKSQETRNHQQVFLLKVGG